MAVYRIFFLLPLLSVSTAFTNVLNVVPARWTRESSVRAVIDIHDSNYQELIMDKDEPVLVDACAPWCGPCKLIEPAVAACAEKFKDSLTVARFDVEEQNPNFKVELAIQDVLPQQLPSLILFVEGRAVATWNGVITEGELENFVKQHTLMHSLNPDPHLHDAKAQAVKRENGFISFVNLHDQDDYMKTPHVS